jgi:hypothetical protein
VETYAGVVWTTSLASLCTAFFPAVVILGMIFVMGLRVTVVVVAVWSMRSATCALIFVVDPVIPEVLPFHFSILLRSMPCHENARCFARLAAIQCQLLRQPADLQMGQTPQRNGPVSRMPCFQFPD